MASIFNGVVLGVFLVAFFIKWVRGTAIFWAALLAQTIIIILFFNLEIGYLWFNFIGCGLTMGFALIIQSIRGNRETAV